MVMAVLATWVLRDFGVVLCNAIVGKNLFRTNPVALFLILTWALESSPQAPPSLKHVTIERPRVACTCTSLEKRGLTLI